MTSSVVAIALVGSREMLKSVSLFFVSPLRTRITSFNPSSQRPRNFKIVGLCSEPLTKPQIGKKRCFFVDMQNLHGYITKKDGNQL
jgi:hypothetical protein